MQDRLVDHPVEPDSRTAHRFGLRLSRALGKAPEQSIEALVIRRRVLAEIVYPLLPSGLDLAGGPPWTDISASALTKAFSGR